MRSTALLIVRLAFALIIITHGWAKLVGPLGITGFAGFLGSMAIPAPTFFSWVIALLEVFGGIAILLGLYVEKVGLLFVLEFLFIVTYVRGLNVSKAELDILMLAAAASLSLMGPGSYAPMGRKKKADEIVA